jgi:hypothetical protein
MTLILAGALALLAGVPSLLFNGAAFPSLQHRESVDHPDT